MCNFVFLHVHRLYMYVYVHIRAGELPKKFPSWVQTRHMGLKNVPKKFGTPGPNLAPNLFGLFVQGHITKAGTPNSTVCIKLNPKRLGAKFGPGVPNFLGTFFRPICRVWTHGRKFFGNSPALTHTCKTSESFSLPLLLTLSKTNNKYSSLHYTWRAEYIF